MSSRHFKLDHDLDSALNQMGMAGIASHPNTSQHAEPAGSMDATLLLNELMGMPTVGMMAAASGGVSGVVTSTSPFLTDLPENGFDGGFDSLSPSHYSPTNHYVTSPLNIPHPRSTPVSVSHSPLYNVGGNCMPLTAGPIAAVGSVSGVGSIATAASVPTSPKSTTLGRTQAVAGLTMVQGAAGSMMGGSPTNFSIHPTHGMSPLPNYEEEERQKREMHNFIERRRRYNINDRIKELGSLLPGSEPDTRQNKGTILKTAVSYIKKLQKIEARHRELSRKHRQYAKTLTVFKSRLEEYDAACQSHGLVVPSASQEAALLTRVDLARVTLDQCVTLVDCLDAGNSECSDTTSIVSSSHSTSSIGASEEDDGWSEDDDTTATQEKKTAGLSQSVH